MSSILRERRLQRLGHVHRMGSERIPKAQLFGELATGLRKRGCLSLRYKYVCNMDMMQANIDPKTWMAANKLKLNDDKTEILLIHSQN